MPIFEDMPTRLHFISLYTSLFTLLNFLSISGHAQSEKYYFDKDWIHCDEADAKYYRVLEEVDTLLKVTDYYVKGGVQSTAFVENKATNKKILEIRGDFEQKTIGDTKYYRRNGTMDYSANAHPFNLAHGIDSIYFELLNSADSLQTDSSQLYFEIYYYKNSNDYGFMLDEDTPHGMRIYVDTRTGIVLHKTPYFNGKMHGMAIAYWKNGKVKLESPYENGFLHGEEKRYNKKGILVKGIEYEKGVKKETWLYQKPKKK